MKTLNQILKGAITAGKGVILTSGLIALLTCSCGDGSDGSGNPNPNGNVESADAGYSNEGGEGSEGGEGGYLPPPRKDAGVNYNDANEGGEGEDVGEGGQEGGEPGDLAPVVIIETKDEQGNLKDTFDIDEWFSYELCNSYDPDCEEKGTCGQSKGIDYCEWVVEGVAEGRLSVSNGSCSKKFNYNISGTKIFKATCYEMGEGLSSTAEKKVTIQ